MKSKNQCFVFIRLTLAVAVLSGLLFSRAGVQPTQAAVVAGFSEYFIPGFTDDLMTALDIIETSNIGTTLTNIITISVGGDNVTVYYDHWENGYGTSSTDADETYTANKGTVLTFKSTNIPFPRGSNLTACSGSSFPAGGSGGSSTRCYDGRDRIFVAGGAVSVAQAFWPTTSNTNYANAWEIYPIKPYQKEYIIPVGENLYRANSSFADFKNVFVFVQSTSNSTNVQIDDPKTAGVEVNTTLNRGETVRLDHIDAGTKVTGSNPLQVQFLVGEDLVVPAQNNSRSYTAVPSSLWSTSYYSPVPGAAGGWDTDLFIYNPTSSALVINYQDSSGSGSFSVAANSTESYYDNVSRYVPTNSAVYLESQNGVTKFWAIGAADAGSPTFNWGFTLIPPHTLTKDYYLSWAPGGWTQGTSTPYQANYSPAFVTPIQNDTVIYVDNSPIDGVVDQTFVLDRIQMQRIYDTHDTDNTGMHIWASAPIAIVWGEDPSTSSQASPGLDAGYTILPLNEQWVDQVITIDKTANPSTLPVAANQESEFTLVIQSYLYGFSGAKVMDTLPSGWNYVNDSTVITLPDGSTITPNPTIAGQLLTWDKFPSAPLDMTPHEALKIVFRGKTNSIPTSDHSTNSASVTGTYGGQVFNADGSTNIYFTDLLVTKSVNPAGSISAGNSLQYTINVLNNNLSKQNNVVVTDPLPVGTSYVPGSAQVTYPVQSGWVGDDFSSQAYTGNDDSGAGDPSWNPAPGTWNEIGEATNATAGDMQVMNDAVEGNAANYELRIQGDGATANGVNRTVDTSSCSKAYLSMRYRRDSLDDTADYVRLSIRTGANPYTTLFDFAGETGGITDAAYKNFSVDISSYLASDTTIQLLGPTTLAANDRVWFDDVLIECYSGTTTAAAGAPPNLITAANSYDLNHTQNLTIVYQVTVDNPIPSGVVNIINKVGVTTDEVPAPIWKYANNSVITSGVSVIGNSVWLDENSDGIQDAGEAGIPNVNVKLFAADGITLLATSTTDAEGHYLFKGVTTGEYKVMVDESTLPSGLSHSTPTGPGDGMNKSNPFSLTVVANENIKFVDFGFNWAPSSDVIGNTHTGAIGDRIWVDTNGNGIQDHDEIGLAGVTVELVNAGADGVFGSGDDATISTISNPSGYFIFDDIAAGVYQVHISTPPSGYTQTGDPDHFSATGFNDNQTTTPIILGPGDVYVNADFGYQPDAGTSASVGDTLWLDLNANGIQDANEIGIPGVSVALIRDTDGDGQWDSGEPIIANAMTDQTGKYLFSGLGVADGSGSDDYLIWVNDVTNILGNDSPTYDSNGTVTPSLSAATNLSSSNNLLQDFGYTVIGQSAGEGAVGDTIFMDRDNDNAYSSGEGLQHVKVQLYTADGLNLIAETYTNQNGQYLFGSLPAGNFLIKVDTSTLPVGLANTKDPDAGILNQAVVYLFSGQVDLEQDFGYQKTSATNSLSGTIWDDTNADGSLDGGESGRFANVTVELDDSNGNLVATTTTNGSGNFSFTNLPDGSYSVDVTDLSDVLHGAWHSLGAAGSDNNSQADPYTVTLSGGATNTTADFGYYRSSASLGDLVWFDRNGNGLQDGGSETGLSGVEVILTIDWSNGASTLIHATTNASGLYNFGNLLLDENLDGTGVGEPGFIITVIKPVWYTPSPIHVGGNNTVDSGDPSGETAQVTKGHSDTTYDFGYNQPIDFGDLPASYNATLLSDNGARHVIGTLTMGSKVDSESDGQPNVFATGDDLNNLNDDDGVTLNPTQKWNNGNEVDIRINLQGSTASGNADIGIWLDWNGDNLFDSATDFFTCPGKAVGATAICVITVPGSEVYTTGNPVNARIRAFDPANLPGGSLDSGDFVGLAYNGEVEDYIFNFNPTAVVLEKFQVNNQTSLLSAVMAVAALLAAWLWRRH